MKWFLVFWLLMPTGCSVDSPLCRLDMERWEPTTTVYGVGVVGECSLEEACALSAVRHALMKIKAEYPAWFYIDPAERKGVLFVRFPEQQTPRMCKVCLLVSRRCVDRWVDYPEVYPYEPSRPDQGYRGLCEEEGNLFVSHMPGRIDTLPKLIGLISHEWACHEAAHLGHGPACRAVSRLARKLALEFVNTLPECACCREKINGAK